jgi:hypothetical protein
VEAEAEEEDDDEEEASNVFQAFGGEFLKSSSGRGEFYFENYIINESESDTAGGLLSTNTRPTLNAWTESARLYLRSDSV